MNTTEARTKFQNHIAAATTQQLIHSALATMNGTTTEARMINAHACEEILRRHPESKSAITEWAEDLDSELDMIEVLIATMNN